MRYSQILDVTASERPAWPYGDRGSAADATITYLVVQFGIPLRLDKMKNRTRTKSVETIVSMICLARTDAISVHSDMLHFRKANPTLVFLLIAFGVPWSVQIFMALKRIPLVPVWPGLILANSFCSVAGFVAAYCELGWAGVTELGHRCVQYRASKGWWAYTLLLCLGIANVTTLAYGLVHGVVGTLKLQDLARQWWLPFTFLFGFIFGPLGEEAGWRGYLLPHLLRQYSPLASSLILGLISALWHFPVGLIVGSRSYFHSVMGLLLFTAGATCMSILVTILVLHTRMSVLHAIVFHWTILPAETISEIIFPPIQQPPDWVRVIALIAVTVVATVIFRKRLWRTLLPSSASSTYEPVVS